MLSIVVFGLMRSETLLQHWAKKSPVINYFLIVQVLLISVVAVLSTIINARIIAGVREQFESDIALFLVLIAPLIWFALLVAIYPKRSMDGDPDGGKSGDK